MSRVGRVDVFHWNPVRVDESVEHGSLVGNFGDLIGPALVNRMLRKIPLVVDDEMPRRTLVSVGSVLHFAPPGATVWGSGVNFKLSRRLPPQPEELDIRAVRGPLTARTLANAGARVPSVFGDPALLLPRYMPELSAWARVESGEVLCVPNLNDFDAMREDAEAHGVAVMSPTVPFEHALRTIACSAFVVGSSLHAIAIADSLGIPARLIVSEREHPFKYRDYLAGSGRPLTRIASAVAEALDLGGHEDVGVDLDELAGAFPHDLWNDEPSAASEPVLFAEANEILETWNTVMAASPPGTAGVEAEFVQTMLPRLIDKARGHLIAGTSKADSFSRVFDEARALRATVLPAMVTSGLNPIHADMVRALDTGVAELGIRAVWLADAGPHAVVRKALVSVGTLLLSIAVRPGRLVNEVSSVEVVLCHEDVEVSRCDVPVFDKYREQWSLDLSCGLVLPQHLTSGSYTLRVTLLDAGGTRTSLEGLSAVADVEVLALTRYGAVGRLQKWVYRVADPGVADSAGVLS